VKAAIDADMVRETHRLNSQMVLLTIAISGGPFLGLLGTVVGVMITFAAIAAAGDVNVNAIAPGAFASEMNREARDHGDATAQTIPARRIGKDEDMAAAAIYLSSNASDYVVGHTLVVDGGVTLARG
jgi:hypothetical protein